MVLLVLRLARELFAWIVSPPRCAACSSRVRARRVFCPPCASSVVEARPASPFPPHLATYVYGGAIARAIVRLKYEPRPELAGQLAELLRRGASRLGSFAPDVVVPVPLFPTRLAERGFNQAALLARPLAEDLGAKLLARALVRTRDTPRQAALERGRRLVNVRKAFAVRSNAALAGKRVLLVDDVRTTGATLRACEEALLEAGVREVRSLVLALADA
jgi:ComF family protein